MENKKVNLQNKGMSQDFSISKETPEYAFENHNIRIQATADNTLFSVTNIQGPTKISSIELEYFKNTQTVIFSEPKLGGTDYILVHNLKYYGDSTSPYTLNKTTDYYIVGTVKTLDYSNQTVETLGRYTNKKILTNTTLKYAEEVSHSTKIHLSDIDTLNDNVECVIGPVKFSTTIWANNMTTPNIRVSSMDGILLGTCDCKDFVVAFTKSRGYDYIYRIDNGDNSYGENIIPVRMLYKGHLRFKLDKPIETLFYLENQSIQKVYFIDGVNLPRVINIITPKERQGTLYKDFSPYLADTFSFYPTTKVLPKFSISKNYNSQGKLPSGVIQYFVSYYYLNGGETNIVASSSVYDIDFETRGAKADEIGGCTFDITISNLDTSFDYVRVYSTIRTSDLGPLQLHIVGDYEITKDTKNSKISFTDYGINQETLEAQQLFFIGGTPLIASTLTEKDNTLFLGNLQSVSNIIPENLKNSILKRNKFTFNIDSNTSIPVYFGLEGIYSTLSGYSTLLKKIPQGYTKTFYKENKDTIVLLPDDIVKKYNINKSSTNITNSNAQDIYFTNYHYKDSESTFLKNLDTQIGSKKYKCIHTGKNQFSSYYDYSRQTLLGHNAYKTFKGGEIYRFGIQFQNKYGQWTDALWLGDKGCYYYPFRDTTTDQLMLNNAIYLIPNEVKSEAIKSGFINYRLLMADPENVNGRKIAAQGVLCPTMFSPGQRALGSSWSIPSWIMRPRGFLCAYHHFEPHHPGYMNDGSVEIDGYYAYPVEGNNIPGDAYTDNSHTILKKFVTTPYYQLKADTSTAPEYLAIQFCVHAGHKLAMKVTKIRSAEINNNFREDLQPSDLYTVIQYNESSEYNKNYGINGWNKIYAELVEWFKANKLDIRDIPSPDILSLIARKQGWSDFASWKSLIGDNNIDGQNVDNSICSLLAAYSVEQGVKFMKPSADMQSVEKGYLSGYVYIDGDSVGNEGNKIPSELVVEDFPTPFGGLPNNQANFLMIKPISTKSYLATEIESESKNFYVDESIVTLHSPEIENTENQKLNLRIVGYVPIDSVYADAEIYTSTPSFMVNGGYDPIKIIKHRYLNSEELVKNPCALYSEYMYVDNAVKSLSNSATEGYMNKLISNSWRVPLWASSGSLIGATTETYEEEPSEGDKTSKKFTKDIIPAKLLKHRTFNQLNSKNTFYFQTQSQCVYADLSRIKVARPENNTTIFNSANSVRIYNNIYDYLVTRDSFHKIAWTDFSTSNAANVNMMDCSPLINDTIRIKYSTTEHAIFDLYSIKNNYKELLPAFPGELKYNGISTTFNGSTGIWESNPAKAFVDSCWTSDEDLYYDDGVIIPIICFERNIQGLEPKTIVSSLEALNNLSEICKTTIIKEFKNNKTPIIALPVITFVIAKNPYTSEESLISFEENCKIFISKIAKQPFNENFNAKIQEFIVAFNIYANLQSNETTYIIVQYSSECLSSIQYKIQDSKIVFTNYNFATSILYDSNYIFKDFNTGIRWRIQNRIPTPYKDFPIKYNQKTIPNYIGSTPSQYLLMGELYKNIANNQLYGGYSDTTNAKLEWIPISNITPLTDNILQSWGDTYYQRWDCLKTFPTTEDDINQVIDITSFMVESHINLDGRTDQNRGNFNIMSRPSNFNLMNSVYNSATPFIYKYSDDSLLTTNIYPNQIAWSLSKNYGASIDSWTNINMLNISKTTYPITKLINFNNQILAITEHAIDVVSFNNKNFVQTSSENIELLNSGKVNGMIRLQSSYGTHNKSTCITEKGLYFIDDNEKSLICISGSEAGIKKIGMSKLDSWFKNNITTGTYSFNTQDKFHLEYDSIYKDLYIINKNTCLIYNENLDSFTSFIEFEDTNFLYNNSGELYSIAHLQSPIIYKMYDGDYNTTYDSKPINYSIEYRINPAPFSDKVFSNVEFIADLGISTSTPNKDTSKVSIKPFDTIHVWNEYQDTLEQPLVFNRNYVSNLQQKFRIWRADIPRDYNSPFHRDRIRNPWIHLKLEKDNITTKNTDKMQLHNLNVGYMI